MRRQHRLADTLIEAIGNKGFDLLLPVGTLTRAYVKNFGTREERTEKSTIDLVFGTAGTYTWAREHLPIETVLALDTQPEGNASPRRLWKQLDEELFKEKFQEMRRGEEATG
ncbi:hypothetical protein LTR44_011519 [Exophiala sp. CCFEE 6388]|nr:hypothetical protein LTR44_011519 [Eurotiomycetes sp. CCFEE 6388]